MVFLIWSFANSNIFILSVEIPQRVGSHKCGKKNWLYVAYIIGLNSLLLDKLQTI